MHFMFLCVGTNSYNYKVLATFCTNWNKISSQYNYVGLFIWRAIRLSHLLSGMTTTTGLSLELEAMPVSCSEFSLCFYNMETPSQERRRGLVSYYTCT